MKQPEGRFPPAAKAARVMTRAVEKGDAVGRPTLNMERQLKSETFLLWINFLFGPLEGRRPQGRGPCFGPGLPPSFDALPLDFDFSTLRPAEPFRHAVALHDQRKIITCSHAADPIRERRSLDAVSAEFALLIDGVGAEEPDAA